MPAPTVQQQSAIDARGDVLVMAGAGAGKTSTLVARILSRVLAAQDPVPLDRLLVVTFNEAAAAEMRHRLRRRLEERRAEEPGNSWIAEQSALLDTAMVSTLHAFCLRLIREHFHELGLDPQFVVQDEVQTGIQRRQVLGEVLRGHYASEAPETAPVRVFLRRHAGDGDAAVRTLILQVHDYARSLPDPAGWRRAQAATALGAEAVAWRSWVPAGVDAWAAGWREEVERFSEADSDNLCAAESHAALVRFAATREAAPVGGLAVPELLAALRVAGDDARFEKGQPGYRKKGRWREPIGGLFEEADELGAFLVPAELGGADPLQEDWSWAREDLGALSRLVEEFDAAFAAARRAAAVVDFADLEQYALQLLWDPEREVATPLAERWRERFELVFVDEYQDINAAQDRIVAAVSREGARANRFFVGDVKQSIYRFRRAAPAIFQDYARRWRGGGGRSVIPLAENFRSHEAILTFVNEVFSGLMRPEIGGVAYDAEARLRFGAPEARAALRERPAGRVELHLQVVAGAGETDGLEGEESAPELAENPGVQDLDLEESQAAIAAARLRSWLENGERIWDPALGTERAVTWRDMVVLHPAPNPVAERWARQFARAGVPFEARRGGFFAALEVADLINLARLLDNPLQDLPALAVLRSPLVGLSNDELAAVRLSRRHGRFWEAVEDCVRGPETAGPEEPGLGGGVETDLEPAVRAARASARARLGWFLGRFGRWRRLAREGSLARCLEVVLAETSYDAWLRAQSRAEARLANVRKLLAVIRQFDQYQRAGLFRFLRFVDAQADSGQEPASATAADGDSVRLLSMHQSKGLEFPVVVVAGLGRRFNLRDLQGEWLLDEEYGVCPPVVPPGRQRGYPSLPRWLAGKRQRREALGEQVRLFYVACTRAADRLMLLGTVREANLARWIDRAFEPTQHQILRATDPLAWLGPRVPGLVGIAEWAAQDQGSGRCLDWVLHRTPPTAVVPEGTADAEPSGPTPPAAHESVDGATVAGVRARLEWRYPWIASTVEPAKTAVTTLRRRWAADEETAVRDPDMRMRRQPKGSAPISDDAVNRGETHHLFFELVDLGAAGSLAGLEAERDRLLREGWVSPEQAALLDLPGIEAFWSSSLGAEIRATPSAVQRELPFTARLRASEAALLGAPVGSVGYSADDFQVVQGVIDLAVLLPDEIWVVDYKTDQVAEDQVEARAGHYAVQLRLYAFALSAIHRRPVTRRCLWFVAPRRLVEVS